MYKAIEYFTDLQDNCYEYKVGDIYPREGYTPTEARIDELISPSNKRGRAVIAKVEAEKVEAEDVEAEKPVEKPKKRTKKKD